MPIHSTWTLTPLCLARKDVFGRCRGIFEVEAAGSDDTTWLWAWYTPLQDVAQLASLSVSNTNNQRSEALKLTLRYVGQCFFE